MRFASFRILTFLIQTNEQLPGFFSLAGVPLFRDKPSDPKDSGPLAFVPCGPIEELEHPFSDVARLQNPWAFLEEAERNIQRVAVARLKLTHCGVEGRSSRPVCPPFRGPLGRARLVISPTGHDCTICGEESVKHTTETGPSRECNTAPGPRKR